MLRWDGRKMKNNKVYIAGPYTQGDVAVNVATAIRAASLVADLGYWPYVPHLSHFWHLVAPRPYEFWCELDRQFLPDCSALIRLPGPSAGADVEVRLAIEHDLPVFYSTDAFAHAATQR
jgi:hypothetical protein